MNGKEEEIFEAETTEIQITTFVKREVSFADFLLSFEIRITLNFSLK